MSRCLCFALLFVTILPLLAQDESAFQERRAIQSGNQSVLLRMRQQLTQELHQLQRMIEAVNPSDSQFLNLLKSQQTELTRQLKDISQQLEGFMLGQKNTMEDSNEPIPSVTSAEQEPDRPLQQNQSKSFLPLRPYSAEGIVPDIPPGPAPVIPNYAPWNAPQNKELISFKQTIESLRTEISDLHETVKALEVQIQLLNRNILLSKKEADGKD